MQAADIPTKMWSLVFRYTVGIDNMTATRSLNEIKPSDKLFRFKTNVSKPSSKVFGSVLFVNVTIEEKKYGAKPQVRSRTAFRIRLGHGWI